MAGVGSTPGPPHPTGATHAVVDQITRDQAEYVQFMHEHGVDLAMPTVTLADDALTIDNGGIDDETFDSPAFAAANDAWNALHPATDQMVSVTDAGTAESGVLR